MGEAFGWNARTKASTPRDKTPKGLSPEELKKRNGVGQVMGCVGRGGEGLGHEDEGVANDLRALSSRPTNLVAYGP